MQFEKKFILKNWDGIQKQDFLPLLQKFQPDILHFVGHASEDGVPLFLNKDTGGELIAADSFIESLTWYKDKLKCVILGACYSEKLAQVLGENIRCVIGCPGLLNDQKEPQLFSPFFYQCLRDGDSVGKAFSKAKQQVKNNDGDPEIFKIYSRQGIDHEKVYLYRTSQLDRDDYLDDIIKTSESFKSQKKEQIPSFLMKISDGWNKNDEEVFQLIPTSAQDIVNQSNDLFHLVDKFLSEENSKYLIVGAPSGTGKSVFIRLLARKLVNSIIEQGFDDDKYFPVFVDLGEAQKNLNRRLENSFRQENLEETLREVIAENDNRKRILFMMDAIDDYDEGAKALLSKIQSGQPYSNYHNRKLILFTKLTPEFPSEFSNIIPDSEYIRLLPMSPGEVDDFLKNENVGFRLHEDSVVSLEKILKDKIKEECSGSDILVDSILKEELVHLRADMGNLLNLQTLVSNSKNNGYVPVNNIAILYHQMAYSHLISEKQDEEKESNIEKWILRRIAASESLYQQLSYKKIKNFLLCFLDAESIKNNNELRDIKNYVEDDKKLKYLIKYYLGLRGEVTDDPEKHEYRFFRKNFMRYFLAEYYLENFLNDKWYRLNLGIPDLMTIIFLKDIVALFSSEKKIFSYKCLFAIWNSINYFSKLKELATYPWSEVSSLDKTEIAEIVGETFKSPLLNAIKRYFLSYFMDNVSIPLGEETSPTELTKESWQVVYEYGRSYGMFIQVHRLLLLLLRQPYQDNVKPMLSHPKIKDKIPEKITLIIDSAHLFSSYLKKFMDFDLSGKDLSRSNLSGSVLCKCNLVGADLRWADLSGADLRWADLSGADLRGADLSGAKLQSLIAEGNFKSSLVGANLAGANLAGADLQNADLSYSILIGCKFDSLMNLQNAKFNNCLIDNEKLLRTLEERKIEVPTELPLSIGQLSDKLINHYKNIYRYFKQQREKNEADGLRADVKKMDTVINKLDALIDPETGKLDLRYINKTTVYSSLQ
jgi:hypothetical protein